jgi:hypothetical protein
MKTFVAALLLAVPVLGFAADAPKTDNTKKCAGLIAHRDALKAKKKLAAIDKHLLGGFEAQIKKLNCVDAKAPEAKAPVAPAKAPEAPAADKK